MLEQHGLASAYGVHGPIIDERYDADCKDARLFEHAKVSKESIIRDFQSLVGFRSGSTAASDQTSYLRCIGQRGVLTRPL